MILLAAVVLIVAAVPLAGGRLSALASMPLRWAWLIAVAAVVQTVLIETLSHSVAHSAAVAIHLLTYGMAIAVLAANRRIPGMLLVALGGLSNVVAIAANGGVMPAAAAARSAAGLAPLTAGAGHAFANSAAVAHARLAFLGDVFPWPRPLPFANVFSLGDVLLVIGIAVVLYRACGCTRPRIRPRPAATPAA